MEQGGGFVPIDFLAAEAPTFTLYGNGVVVFQPRVAQFPQPDAAGVIHNIPWRTAKLDEGQVQELLGFAITQGWLGTARAVYMASGIADAPSTIFTLRAGGLDKTVTIEALNEETAQGPDTLARSAFIRLAQRLEDFDGGGTIGSDVYEPAAYRGALSERDAGAIVPRAWPWPGLKPADFKAGPDAGNGGVFLPHRTMTADEVAALGIKDVTGGLQGVVLKGPDGKIYGFTARPLLLDEKE
jgi:hypothetical protein